MNLSFTIRTKQDLDEALTNKTTGVTIQRQQHTSAIPQVEFGEGGMSQFNISLNRALNTLAYKADITFCQIYVESLCLQNTETLIPSLQQDHSVVRKLICQIITRGS